MKHPPLNVGVCFRGFAVTRLLKDSSKESHEVKGMLARLIITLNIFSLISRPNKLLHEHPLTFFGLSLTFFSCSNIRLTSFLDHLFTWQPISMVFLKFIQILSLLPLHSHAYCVFIDCVDSISV